MTHGFCNEATQLRLEKDSECEIKIKGDPFKTLEAIKLKMCDPSKVKCPFVTLCEQVERPLTTKQEDDEGTVECTKRFKQQQDNVDSIMGKEWTETFTESTSECTNENDATKKKDLKDKDGNSFQHFIFLYDLVLLEPERQLLSLQPFF